MSSKIFPGIIVKAINIPCVPSSLW